MALALEMHSSGAGEHSQLRRLRRSLDGHEYFCPQHAFEPANWWVVQDLRSALDASAGFAVTPSTVACDHANRARTNPALTLVCEAYPHPTTARLDQAHLYACG